ncbi:MAG: hypothetical protein EA350_00960 [Gemmatimonadales bacterium]|nr:MAG: hypothetical protein EA350_00960 [Gemmatimonadales bacterium]
MTASVTAIRLELRPSRRPEAIDLGALLDQALGEGGTDSARHFFFISHHTTAGFLDPGLRQRLAADPKRLAEFLAALGSVFPPDAGYEHDQLHLRDELTAAQRETEPLNADAHLAFIGGGFTNCISVPAGDHRPLWFIDLDGVYLDRNNLTIRRTRSATVVGYHQEELTERVRLHVPVPRGAGVVRLDDPEFGIFPRIRETLDREGISSGRVGIRLSDPSPGVGITVNEFEALLMGRDLTRALADPLGFARSGAEALAGTLSALGMASGRLRRLMDRALAHPAGRFLRMQRQVSLGVLPPEDEAGSLAMDSGQPGVLVSGTYQSPLLVQRAGTAGGRRALEVEFHRFG